jgi:ribosome assembly protein SQT1
MNPEEEDTEEEDDYEPAFVDASAADVTVHLDLNETDEPPPPDDDDDDLDEEEEEDLEEEEDGVMMEDVAVEDRDAADESVLRPEKDECEMKMEERKGSIFAVAWATTTKRDDGEGGSVEREVMCAGGSDDRAVLTSTSGGGGVTTTTLENTGKDSVSAVKFSRHSNGSNNSEVLLATANLDGTVSVHDADGRYLRQLEGPETGVEWLEWHPNGPIVLAGCEDFCAWMWNASDGNLMQVFAGHSGSVSCGQFSKDGKVVFTGSFDGSFRAWNPRSGMAIAAFQKGGLFHDGPVTCMDSKVDDNGNYLVLTGSEDCTLKLSTVHANAADVGAGGSKVLGNFFAHEKCIECVEFCDGTVGNYAASGSVDATIRVWDLPTQKVRGVLGHGKAVSQLKWVPNSAMLYRCARFRFSKVVCALASFFSSSSKLLSRFFLFATKGPGATS